VATSSFTDEARRVLDVFGLRVLLDDVVIIEDSPIGTRAAMASGAAWICVSTPFSRPAIEAAPWIDRRWTVHGPAKLGETFACRIELIEQG
jgi:beta-phosphoglucomutase-like phosphatase (HAD superfamily)